MKLISLKLIVNNESFSLVFGLEGEIIEKLKNISGFDIFTNNNGIKSIIVWFYLIKVKTNFCWNVKFYIKGELDEKNSNLLNDISTLVRKINKFKIL